jgi:hypothetical protein
MPGFFCARRSRFAAGGSCLAAIIAGQCGPGRRSRPSSLRNPLAVAAVARTMLVRQVSPMVEHPCLFIGLRALQKGSASCMGVSQHPQRLSPTDGEAATSRLE